MCMFYFIRSLRIKAVLVAADFLHCTYTHIIIVTNELKFIFFAKRSLPYRRQKTLLRFLNINPVFSNLNI